MPEEKKTRKKAGDKKSEVESVSIEESFERLEEIIKLLEDPKTSLTEAVKYYSEGVKLLEGSRTLLEGVEQQLKVLMPEKM